MLPIFDYAGLPQAQINFVRRTFGSFTMLSQVLQWGAKQSPRVVVDEVIAMDEYTHDVLIALSGERYLAFDTT